MAIGTPTSLFTPSQSVTVATSRATPSFSPTAGYLVTISGYCREDVGSAAAPVVTITNTHAGSWSWNAGLTRGNTQSQRRRLFAFWALAPSGAGSGTVTITADKDCDEWVLAGWECSGASDTITNTDTGVSTSATPANTLPSAPASSSYVFGALFSSGDTDGVTPGSSFTELVEVIPGVGSSTYQAQYRTGSTSTTCGWSAASTTASIMLSWEVVEGAVVSAPQCVFMRRRAKATTRFLED